MACSNGLRGVVNGNKVRGVYYHCSMRKKWYKFNVNIYDMPILNKSLFPLLLFKNGAGEVDFIVINKSKWIDGAVMEKIEELGANNIIEGVEYEVYDIEDNWGGSWGDLVIDYIKKYH